MLTSFHINTSELGEDFLSKLKRLFGERKDLVITVEEDDDTTFSLLSSPANRKNLEQSISELNSGNLITVSLEDLRK